MFLWETISPRKYIFILIDASLPIFGSLLCYVPTFLLCGKHKIRYANTQIICISPKVIHFSCFSRFSEDDLLYNIERNNYYYLLHIFYSEIFLYFFMEKYANQIVECNYFTRMLVVRENKILSSSFSYIT